MGCLPMDSTSRLNDEDIAPCLRSRPLEALLDVQLEAPRFMPRFAPSLPVDEIDPLTKAFNRARAWTWKMMNDIYALYSIDNGTPKICHSPNKITLSQQKQYITVIKQNI